MVWVGLSHWVCLYIDYRPTADSTVAKNRRKFGATLTPFDFDREYLRKGSIYRKSEQNSINYNPFHIGRKTGWTLVHKQKRSSGAYWPTEMKLYGGLPRRLMALKAGPQAASGRIAAIALSNKLRRHCLSRSWSRGIAWHASLFAGQCRSDHEFRLTATLLYNKSCWPRLASAHPKGAGGSPSKKINRENLQFG